MIYPPDEKCVIDNGGRGCSRNRTTNFCKV